MLIDAYVIRLPCVLSDETLIPDGYSSGRLAIGSDVTLACAALSITPNLVTRVVMGGLAHDRLLACLQSTYLDVALSASLASLRLLFDQEPADQVIYGVSLCCNGWSLCSISIGSSS